MKQCHFCGWQDRRGFTRRWLSVTPPLPVWVCMRVVDCERRRGMA